MYELYKVRERHSMVCVVRKKQIKGKGFKIARGPNSPCKTCGVLTKQPFSFKDNSKNLVFLLAALLTKQPLLFKGNK